MAYAVANDLYNVYGKRNIQRWADLDNDDNQFTIDARITWALELSEEWLNDRLRRGRYTIPIAGTAPKVITHITALQAGLFLHDGRKVIDDEANDQVSAQRKTVDKYLSQILSGQIKLDLELQSRDYPFVPE